MSISTTIIMNNYGAEPILEILQEVTLLCKEIYRKSTTTDIIPTVSIHTLSSYLREIFVLFYHLCLGQ